MHAYSIIVKKLVSASYERAAIAGLGHMDMHIYLPN
jgi:hypothetical protein